MDSTSLRWVLAIIGVVVIAGVYVFSIYQARARRQAAIKTFTADEVGTDAEIVDANLRDELAHINTMLDQEVEREDIEDISINPALDSEKSYRRPRGKALHLPDRVMSIPAEDRVLHVLKAEDDRLFTGAEISDALHHVGLVVDQEGVGRIGGGGSPGFRLAALNDDGLLKELEDPEFFCYGLVCYFDRSRSRRGLESYELMLKKIDELVRLLDIKVYDEALLLLTLKHVTDTRGRLGSPEQEPSE